jgi:molybdenum cofactor biosynthesis enzyme MoaA
MTAADLRHVRLDRAHLQGKVIAANLEHLAVVLTAGEPELREDLASFSDRFGRYVRRLDRACNAAGLVEEGIAVR